MHGTYHMKTKTPPNKKLDCTIVGTPATRPSQSLHATPVSANHVSLFRLAEQLDRNPDELAAEIFAAGIEALDWGLRECREIESPLHLETCTARLDHRRTFDLTGRMNTMKPSELVALEARAARQCRDVPLQAIVPATPSPVGKRPIYFPARTVQLLEDLCEASGFGDV
ncbi:MAG: hypothetical protein CFE26_16470, partial [Verrucomicrobiales bacterium VVV1]